MMGYLFAFLMLAAALGAGALAARAVAAIPQSVLAHAEEAGRYALLGSVPGVPPQRPASGRRLRTLLAAGSFAA